VVGQLVHRALALWSFPGDDPRFRLWAEAEARDCGLINDRQLRDALYRAGRLLRRFCATALYAEMQQASVRLGEIPYSVEANGAVDSGIMDALYRNNQGWMLVEFKTDHITSQDQFQQLANDYRPQLSRYLEACSSLVPLHQDGPAPVRGMLCFLDYMGRVELIDGLP